MIPAELKEMNRWVACLPNDVALTRGSRVAYCCKVSTWLSFDAAAALAREHGGDVAFAMMHDDPYTAVTIDNRVSNRDDIVRSLDSYTEHTADGTGVRVIIKGVPLVGTSGITYKGVLEIFDRFRFCRLTGKIVENRRGTIEERQKQLNRLWKDVFPGKRRVALQTDLSDDEIIEEARRSDEQFRELWDGQVAEDSENGLPTLMLMGKLAYWTQRDPGRMERLFVRSALYDPRTWRKASYREAKLRTSLLDGVDTVEVPKVTVGHLKEEEAVAVAVELAADLKQRQWPEWQLPFKLAQRLRSLGSEPGAYQKACDAFSTVLRLDPEITWYEFVLTWKRVKKSSVDCTFGEAARLAVEKPVEDLPRPGPQYRLAASLVIHLSRLSPDGIFPLST